MIHGQSQQRIGWLRDLYGRVGVQLQSHDYELLGSSPCYMLILIADEGPIDQEPRHWGVTCDHCLKNSFKGGRYKCGYV